MMGGKIEIDSLELEETCHWHNTWGQEIAERRILECRGGEVWDYTDSVPVKADTPCPRCKGRGTNPTYLGSQILDFVKKHLGIEVSE